MAVAITASDIDFLIARFEGLTARRDYVLPSDYIESVRYIDKSLSPFPGKFSYEKFPYFKEIVNQLSPASPTKYVFVMKGNQCGYTTGVLEPGMMYNIGCVPSEQALFLPDDVMVKQYSETKLENCIDNCNLREKIASTAKKAKGARNTGDTVFHKQYAGGNLRLFGSKSGTRFRNFSFKTIFADEADAALMSIKGEGDIIPYASCSYLVNCSAKSKNGYELTRGFFGCSYLTGCSAEMTQDDASTTVKEISGFSRCSRIMNCHTKLSNNSTKTLTNIGGVINSTMVMNTVSEGGQMYNSTHLTGNNATAYTSCYADDYTTAAADTAAGGFNHTGILTWKNNKWENA